jgi:hypothetical protein
MHTIERKVYMSNNNIEQMKKIIEEKKKTNLQVHAVEAPKKTIGTSQKAIKKFRKGGVFDK